MFKTTNTDTTILASQIWMSSAAVFFCAACNKPFANEAAHKRHSSYCGRRTRVRPRSCRACNAAKSKCSFESPCTRCLKRSINCIYQTSTSPADQDNSQDAMHKNVLPSSKTSNEQVFLFDGADLNTTDAEMFDEFSQPPITVTSVTKHPDSISKSLPFTFPTSIEQPLLFDDVFSRAGLAENDLQSFTNVPTFPTDDGISQDNNWCTWMRRDISLLVVAETSSIRPDQDVLATFDRVRPYAQLNADIVMLSLRSLPTMMLRRETFPWFIHTHTSLLVSPDGCESLPEALSSCMSIAQMFMVRTPETKHFIWQGMRDACRGFLAQMRGMTCVELLTAIQSSMIYLIISIMDYSHEYNEYVSELLLTLSDLYCLFKTKSAQSLDFPVASSTILSWENWMFQESQKRVAHLWFLIGCVVYVKYGLTYDVTQSYRSLPLPCSKRLWEASTRQEWQAEQEEDFNIQACGLVTLGDLMDAQSRHTDLNIARKLDIWNAGADNLGSLLNVIGTMV